MSEPGQVTHLLLAWRAGDQQALEELMPHVYAELRRIAARQFAGEQAGHLLQPTALVHEAYVRLIDQHDVSWKDRAHFFGVAGLIMRRLLVDHARAQRAAKRGQGRTLLPLNEEIALAETREVDMLVLDDALTRLERIDERKSRVVALRFFVGLTNEEVAEALRMSVTNVRRDWSIARAWLRSELGGEGAI